MKKSANNWDGGVQPSGGAENLQYVKLEEPWKAMPIREQSAEDAYALVLQQAGATLPKRDIIDSRIVNEVKGGFTSFEGASYKKNKQLKDMSVHSGIIDTQLDVGGWPLLRPINPPTDTVHDGMPDEWELKNKLDKNDPLDRNMVSADGYTMLEKYLHSREN